MEVLRSGDEEAKLDATTSAGSSCRCVILPAASDGALPARVAGRVLERFRGLLWGQIYAASFLATPPGLGR